MISNKTDDIGTVCLKLYNLSSEWISLPGSISQTGDGCDPDVAVEGEEGDGRESGETLAISCDREHHYKPVTGRERVSTYQYVSS